MLKIHGPWLLVPSGFKLFYIKVDILKNWYCKIYYSRYHFRKTLHRRCLVGFWIDQGSECTKVLNMRGFWIYHGSEYASGFEYDRSLNIPRLRRGLNMPECARIVPEYVWLCMNRYECGWICGNIHWYT